MNMLLPQLFLLTLAMDAYMTAGDTIGRHGKDTVPENHHDVHVWPGYVHDRVVEQLRTVSSMDGEHYSHVVGFGRMMRLGKPWAGDGHREVQVYGTCTPYPNTIFCQVQVLATTETVRVGRLAGLAGLRRLSRAAAGPRDQFSDWPAPTSPRSACTIHQDGPRSSW